MNDYQKTKWHINLWGLILMATLSEGGWKAAFSSASLVVLVIYLAISWRD